MTYKQSHSTTVTIDGEDFELELDLELSLPEPDVGLFGVGIDDWTVTSVNGDTDDAVCSRMNDSILNEYGDETFVKKLYNEDAAELYYDDYSRIWR
jgi:hypothetical protein